MSRLSDETGALWYDDDAGPMVRPYTVTRGRTRSGPGVPELDVIALVTLADPEPADPVEAGPASADGVRSGAAPSGTTGPPPPDGPAGAATPPEFPVPADRLAEEHLALLDHCRAGPMSVADLAAAADLPLGVVRVLIGDLLAAGRVRVTQPVPPAELPDVGLLQSLISGLRSL